MAEAWLRYQQDLALAAFVASCSIAEMQLRLVEAALAASAPRRRHIRLVSDLHGLLVEKDPP